MKVKRRVGKMGHYFIEVPDTEAQVVNPPKEKPKAGGRPNTPVHIQQAILADRAIGLSRDVCAEKYGVHVRTVDRIFKAFKAAKEKTNPELGESKEVIVNQFRRKAVKAVNAGLDCTKDAYRRAGIGVKVMEGIGDFKSNEVTINNFNLVANTPAEMRARYLGIEDKPEENDASGR